MSYPTHCPDCGNELSPYKGPNGKEYMRCLSCIALKQQIQNFKKFTPDELDAQELKTRQSYRRNMEAIARIRAERVEVPNG